MLQCFSAAVAAMAVTLEVDPVAERSGARTLYGCTLSCLEGRRLGAFRRKGDRRAILAAAAPVMRLEPAISLLPEERKRRY
jgi:hypothetical protein